LDGNELVDLCTRPVGHSQCAAYILGVMDAAWIEGRWRSAAGAMLGSARWCPPPAGPNGQLPAAVVIPYLQRNPAGPTLCGLRADRGCPPKHLAVCCCDAGALIAVATSAREDGPVGDGRAFRFESLYKSVVQNCSVSPAHDHIEITAARNRDQTSRSQLSSSAFRRGSGG
jgi:hypothetical protein